MFHKIAVLPAVALLLGLSPLAAQMPPQVLGVQLQATSTPAPGDYTLTGSFGGELIATSVVNGKITSFTLDGEEFRWKPHKGVYGKVSTPQIEYKFIHIYEGTYEYSVKVFDTYIGGGTACAN